MSPKKPTAPGGIADRLAGKVKAVAGGLLDRDDLSEEGELQQAKAARAEEAARLEAEAQQAADEARTEAELEANAVERARVQAEIDEAERLDEIERERRTEQAQADLLAQRRAESLEREAAAEEAVLDRREDAVQTGERLEYALLRVLGAAALMWFPTGLINRLLADAPVE